VIARARKDDGFGLVELMVSMVMLNVGILAVVAAFNAGVVALRTAGEVSTASVLADKQMELYRALLWDEIALDQTELAAANADATYQCDDANKIDPAGACGGANQAAPLTPPTTCAPLTPQCDPSQAVSGPDGHPYRVDTYIVSQTPAGGRAVKLVTVVVRKATNLQTLTRLSTTFDESSGS
jgi:hypothetical protein